MQMVVVYENKNQKVDARMSAYTLVAHQCLEGITLGLNVRLKAAGLTKGFVSAGKGQSPHETRSINIFGAETYLSDWS